MRRKYSIELKSMIIYEYNKGDPHSILKLSKKYGISKHTIRSWISSYYGKDCIHIILTDEERRKRREIREWDDIGIELHRLHDLGYTYAECSRRTGVPYHQVRYLLNPICRKNNIERAKKYAQTHRDLVRKHALEGVQYRKDCYMKRIQNVIESARKNQLE